MTALYIRGRPVRLGERVGRGGEGEVFVLADRPDQAVKLYSSPDDRRREKIEAMVAAGLSARSDLVAFPLAVVQGPGGAFAGFAMRLVRGHKPLFELYAPGAGTVRNFVREAIGWNGRDHRYGNRQGRFGPASGWS